MSFSAQAIADHSPNRLPAWALFAGLIAAAGLPIYIHAPKFYVDEYGVSLAALGSVLFGLRLLDVVQDPALGWLSERYRTHRRGMVAVAAALMALAMLGLFGVVPPVAPLLWFAITLAVLFSAFSFLSITFYAEGVAKASRLGSAGHMRLAGWREGGALTGVSLAAVAPVALGAALDRPFAGFAAGFAVLALVAVLAMRGQWSARRDISTTTDWQFGVVLRDSVARRLLLLALVNAAPVAVTSTLFLFFVESRLAAPGLEGPLLLLFFLSAAASTPVWTWLATRYGAKPVLMAGMGLAIAAFAMAATLGPGEITAFAVICAASGAALGADMTLLPAIFARRMAIIAPDAGAGFGLWSFVSKFTLAFAAVTLLPLLESRGFAAGPANPEPALELLSVLYALVPCALKALAIVLLATTPVSEDTL
ncbi:MAG: MFS transporter [Gemmobacter sp.]|nr:MFS transporter [Gemmobacter sp.]